MGDARASILRQLRRSLGRDKLPLEQLQSATQRLNNARRHTLPMILDKPAVRFIHKLQHAGATVEQLSSINAVPAAITKYIEVHNAGSGIVIAPVLSNLSWPDGLELEFGPTHGEHNISVTPCFAAVAETGSVVLLSSRESPTSLNFLPDDHVVVVRASQIVTHMEDVWSLLQQQGIDMPRTVNFITGPSRTADVEQTIQLGAHGPRRLHVLLIA